jgi:WD40 repeat protein
MLRATLSYSLLAFLMLVGATAAQSIAQEACPALTIPQIVPGADIFDMEQEITLGDAIAAGIQQSIHVIHDPLLTEYLQTLISRLAQPLPPSHIPLQAAVMEEGSADAFSIPGGRIYISRKLVALTRSEDELAGVLAHEIGHIAARHAALQMSEAFRRTLGVTQVGDRNDVVAKWNQYLSNYRRQHVSSVDVAKAERLEEREQNQADTIALYLVSRAGYSTQAFVDVFDRMAETKGKTASFWSDLFGTTTEDSKRLRELVKHKPAMPPSCIQTPMQDTAKFTAWRYSVLEYSATGHQGSLPGLISQRSFNQRLRPEIQYVRISPDGKYVLAQDDDNIFVLTREPLKPLFRIDAPDAEFARFTPDSRGVVFHIAGFEASPRVERWDISTQKRLDLHEIYVRKGCLTSALSPDGKTLACLTNATSEDQVEFDLDLFDTATGTSYWHKKNWIFLNAMHFDWSSLNRILVAEIDASQRQFSILSPLAFSPDGHYLVAHSHDSDVVFDLSSRTQVNLPGNFRTVLELGNFTFVGNDRFFGVAGTRGDKSELVEFPSGRVLQKDVVIGGSRVSRVAHGDYLLLRPIKDNPMGVFDLKQGKIVLAGKRSALDLWDDKYIAERIDGDLQVFDLGTVKPVEHVQLPEAPLGTIRAGAVSPDLKWLAVSQSSRGAVWDLQSGQRLYHMRGFRGAYFTADGNLYADFPKFLQTERQIARFSLPSSELSGQQTLGDAGHTAQVGRYLLTLVPAKENGDLNRNVTMELRSVTENKLLWSKHFLQERPGYFADADTGSLVFYWQAGSAAIRTLAKDDSEVAAKLAPYKNKEGVDYVEIFDLASGKSRARLVIDTGKNSFRVRDMTATGSRLVLADTNNRVLIYTLSGEEKGCFPASALRFPPMEN